jgi:hypothetical protein
VSAFSRNAEISTVGAVAGAGAHAVKRGIQAILRGSPPPTQSRTVICFLGILVTGVVGFALGNLRRGRSASHRDNLTTQQSINDMIAMRKRLVTAFNSHTHTTPGGDPTGPPRTDTSNQ